MAGDIKVLETLNEALQGINLDGIVQRSDNRIDFDLPTGMATVFNLFNKPGIAVAEGFMSKDTIFPLHSHENSKEFFIVYKGAMSILCECGEKYDLIAGSSCEVDKKMYHSIHVKEDCRFVTITVPADPIFPK